MKRTNTFTRLITLTIAMLAVIGFNWTPGPVAAIAQSESQNNLEQITLGMIGFVPGQTLRITALNPNAPEQGNDPVRAQVQLYREREPVLIHSGESGGPGEVDLRPGEFHSFDVNRADLDLAGEPGTGRLQVRVEIIYRYTDSPGPIPPENFTVSTEIFDNRSGETKVYQSGTVGWVKLSPDA